MTTDAEKAKNKVEAKIKQVRNVVQKLATGFIIEEDLNPEERKVVTKFAAWLDSIMSEDVEEGN